MIKIAGIWEIGWTTPIMEMDLWRFMIAEFNVDEFIMSPISGIANNLVKEVVSLDQAIHDNPHLNVVHVTADADVDLTDFAHPLDALYLFGTANHDTVSCMEVGHQAVRIPTLTNQGGFWPHQAAAIILYDRYLKSK